MESAFTAVTPVVLLPMPGAEALAAQLAGYLPASTLCAGVESRRFPDGESWLRVLGELRDAQVVIVGNLYQPDPQALSLLYLADYAREMGALRVGLVAPYLPYMRQDARFHPGEAITSRSFARFVSSAVDWLVTVDPHLHRYASLDEIYTISTRVVPAAPVMAAWIAAHVERPFVVGPDSESAQWAAEVARLAGCPHAVLEKQRHGDRDVEISLSHLTDTEGRTPVLIDDIISSARTMTVAVRMLRAAGLPPPVCIGVHALFAGDAAGVLAEAGAARVVTCNTVPHASNGIDVLPALASAILPLLR